MINKTPHYRIDDPQSGLAVYFHCVAAPTFEAPKVMASLVAPPRATTFMSYTHAAECFARFVAGQALEIVRVDA